MQGIHLLPHRYQRFGWFLFVPGLILCLIVLTGYEPGFLDSTVFGVGAGEVSLASHEFSWIGRNNLFNEIACGLLILGGMLVAFSREHLEDEYIQNLRLSSLLWAVYVNYAILLIAVLFIYDVHFFTFMSINIFTVLLFFIIRFRWILYRSNKQVTHEK